MSFTVRSVSIIPFCSQCEEDGPIIGQTGQQGGPRVLGELTLVSHEALAWSSSLSSKKKYCPSFLHFCFVLFLEVGSYYVAQAGLGTNLILLSQPPK
jgi:hypothetical protein